MRDSENIMLTLSLKERNQAWLARKIGVDVSLITLLLQGKRRFQRYQKRAIAAALEVPEQVLFCSDDDAKVVTR